jgi:hypothetical protein
MEPPPSLSKISNTYFASLKLSRLILCFEMMLLTDYRISSFDRWVPPLTYVRSPVSSIKFRGLSFMKVTAADGLLEFSFKAMFLILDFLNDPSSSVI